MLYGLPHSKPYLPKIVHECIQDFDEAIRKFFKFLKIINAELPGPQHPGIKFYRMRKKKIKMVNKDAGQVLNPQRANKADRGCRQEHDQHELAQYNYYNTRKNVVQNITNADAPK